MRRTYNYNQMNDLERSDPSLNISCGKEFYPRGTYVRNRYGIYVRVIRIISYYSSGGFDYLCEYTWFGAIKTFFYKIWR